jgi:hypothetical protein
MNAPAKQTSTAKHKTRFQKGCLVMLVCFFAFLALSAYPHDEWRFGAVFGLISLVSLFLRVGWVVPLTIAGIYFGMILDPPVKDGNMESRYKKTVCNILFGAIAGFAAGAFIDATRDARRHQAAADGTTTDGEQSVGHGAADKEISYR